MNRPYSQIRCGNRIIQQKQDTLSLEKHYESLRKARPMTGNTVERNSVSINNRKRQMVMENRFTEIERQNRILFQKITSIMHKGQLTQTISSTDRPSSVMNKTLNGVYRKKQLQNIEYQNAKMLKRLKQKKSSYGVQQLHQDWIKKKKVIKNMSLYPFILNDKNNLKTRQAEINLTQQNIPSEKSRQIKKFKQMRRIRKIDGYIFLVTLKYESNKFYIIGDIRQQQNIKVIQLNRSEAEQFINQECDGKMQNIFNMLRYDNKSGVLFLVGKEQNREDADEDHAFLDHQGQQKQFEFERRRVKSQHEARRKRAITAGIKNEQY